MTRDGFRHEDIEMGLPPSSLRSEGTFVLRPRELAKNPLAQSIDDRRRSEVLADGQVSADFTIELLKVGLGGLIAENQNRLLAEGTIGTQTQRRPFRLGWWMHHIKYIQVGADPKAPALTALQVPWDGSLEPFWWDRLREDRRLPYPFQAGTWKGRPFTLQFTSDPGMARDLWYYTMAPFFYVSLEVPFYIMTYPLVAVFGGLPAYEDPARLTQVPAPKFDAGGDLDDADVRVQLVGGDGKLWADFSRGHWRVFDEAPEDPEGDLPMILATFQAERYLLARPFGDIDKEKIRWVKKSELTWPEYEKD